MSGTDSKALYETLKLLIRQIVTDELRKHTPTIQGASFDLFRLSKAKQIVDVCPNTIRDYFRRGLPKYTQGKAIFISKHELESFIRDPASFQRQGKKRG